MGDEQWQWVIQKDLKSSSRYTVRGVRIYRITPDGAQKIIKQFPEAFRYKLSFASTDLFYMNVNHGEQHQVFSVDGKDL